MSDPQIIAGIVGLLTAFGLLVGRIPVERIAAAMVKVIESHSASTAFLIERINACEKKHAESDLRIDLLEAQKDADDAVIERSAQTIVERDETIETLAGRIKALRAEQEDEERAEDAARHARTTHRGDPE